MRIMIVDDEKDICDVACLMLRDYGECIAAQDGKSAIGKLLSYWEKGETIDCIFLDYMMPEMDGITTLKNIRGLEFARLKQGIQDKAIIIIFLTASNSPKIITGAFKEQSDGYITKPFDPEKLVAEMKKLGLLTA